jgi:DNA-binding response OmpR family regulator
MKKRILLVDDEEGLLVTVGDYLEFEGYEVEKARTAEDALRKLARVRPDLVVLDLAMPGMGGMGFLKELGERGGGSKCPVLVLTARSNMQSFFENLDVEGFLPKPCEKAVLLGKIEEILARQAESAGDPAPDRGCILLGEDDPSKAAVLRHALTTAGYEVEVADTGPAVLERAALCAPRLILVKDILTHMNGEAVVALLKAMPKTSGTPVVLYDEELDKDSPVGAGRLSSGAVARHVHSNETDALLNAVSGLLGP